MFILVHVHFKKISLSRIGVPYGIRTRVAAVRGRRPRPLDEGDTKDLMQERYATFAKNASFKHVTEGIPPTSSPYKVL